MVYIFIYNVVYIKTDFKKIKELTNSKLVLIGSNYCIEHLSSSNKCHFDDVYQVSRNFQQINYDEVANIVSGYVNEYGASNIMLLTNEDSTQVVCAQLRELYGIIGNNVKTVLPFVNKVVSKNKLDNVVRIPKFTQFDKNAYLESKELYLGNLVDKIGGFPMFAKPIDLVSSIETHYIADFKSLYSIAERISEQVYEFEIDEFIDGELFHCDAMIINNQVKFFMAGKCSFALARFFEGKPVGSIPIHDKTLFTELQIFSEKVFNKLSCPNGAYHLEAFWDKVKQELVFLEVGARTGGALISRVYQKLFNINIEEVNYLIQLGFLNELNVAQPEVFAGFLNFPIIKGKLIKFNKPFLNIQSEFIEFVEEGKIMKTPDCLLDIACSMIFWDKSYTKVEKTFEFLKNYNVVEFIE